jgi:hypothetical protein
VLKLKASFLGLMAVLVAGFALGGQAIPNWSAPATWTPTRSSGAHALDITNPLPFVGVTPCRVADTRGNGFGGAYGPPSLVANANRTFVIVGQCGIPASAQAVSFNFGALNVGGGGDLRVFPDGFALPLVSTMNYNASTPNIANAAVVPLGGAGGITVRADAVSIDLIIDVNGYYYDGTSVALPVGRQFQIIGTCNGCSTLYGENTSTTTNSRAVRGHGSAATGVNYGVLGDNLSTTAGSAGVAGTDGTGNPTGTSNLSAGVIGQSTTHIGVQGDSQNAAVRGESYTSAGAFLHLGILGGTTYGVFSNGDYAGIGAKFFVEPHPTDANLMIRYIALEGNEPGTYFRGTATTVGGEAVIDVPEDFRFVTDEEGLTVQLTPVGRSASMFVLSEDLNQIIVHSSRDVKFHYQVNGIRRTIKGYQPISPGRAFMPLSAEAPAGLASYTPEIQQRLIANGTYNPDGSINMNTAERLGWTKIWEEQSRPATTQRTEPSQH